MALKTYFISNLISWTLNNKYYSFITRKYWIPAAVRLRSRLVSSVVFFLQSFASVHDFRPPFACFVNSKSPSHDSACSNSVIHPLSCDFACLNPVIRPLIPVQEAQSSSIPQPLTQRRFQDLDLSRRSNLHRISRFPPFYPVQHLGILYAWRKKTTELTESWTEANCGGDLVWKCPFGIFNYFGG